MLNHIIVALTALLIVLHVVALVVTPVGWISAVHVLAIAVWSFILYRDYQKCGRNNKRQTLMG